MVLPYVGLGLLVHWRVLPGLFQLEYGRFHEIKRDIKIVYLFNIISSINKVLQPTLYLMIFQTRARNTSEVREI